jgi:hypothetical protein
MDEIAGRRLGHIFPVGAPAYLTNALQDVCDRLLFSVMMNPGVRVRLHLEEAAP